MSTTEPKTMSKPQPGHAASDDSLSGRVSGASSVLVLAGDESQGKPAACEDLLSDGPASATGRVVGVSYRPEYAFYDRIARTGGRDADRTVVAVTGTESGHPEVETETVPDPADVPGAVRGRLSGVDDAGVVCFDAVEDLLADIGLTRTFRFVNGVAADLRDTDAVAHFHLDPDAGTERAPDALATVFDAVVRSDGENEWEVAWTRDAD